MMKQKSKAFKCFKHWMTLLQNQTGKKVKRLRMNNGLKFCKDEDIARQNIVQHTPQQNEVSEKMNKTLFERVRCVLSNSRLNRIFLVVDITCYLMDHSPSLP